MGISATLTEETKEKMKEVLQDREQEAYYLRQNIKETAAKIQEEAQTLSPRWLRNYIEKLQRDNYELGELQSKIEMLKMYSGAEKS